jgi:acyl-ACP thioesterase
VEDLAAPPRSGRCFRSTRRVRLADADPGRRLRLDALARLLQDLGNDDMADAGLDPSSPWVARRTVVEAARWPELGERLVVETWCGGLGPRWAERRTSLTGEGSDASVEVASLWVHLGPGDRPAPLPADFVAVYGDAAGGRSVSARLRHRAGPGPDAAARPWPVRSADLDVLGHVNNAATWQAVEDELWRRGLVPARAELEYREALDPGDDVVLRSEAGEGGLRLWLTVGDEVRASATVLPALG